jgi:hypothetical protein
VTTLAIFSTLFGSMLGIRFRFLVLLPVLFVGSVSLVAISIAQGKTLPQATTAVMVFGLLLQIGYLCTGLFRSIVRTSGATGAVPHTAGVVLVRKSRSSVEADSKSAELTSVSASLDAAPLAPDCVGETMAFSGNPSNI